MSETLFELPPPKLPKLVLTAGKPIYNYRRIQNGQNMKVNLRDQKGKIVATVYGGPDMAAHIVASVNAAAMRESTLPKPDPNWEEICAKCRDGEIEPDNCEHFGEPNGCNSPSYGKHPKAAPVGNAAALREALVSIKALVDDEPDGTPMIDAMKETVDAALAAPPRNCDVGTPEEQDKRFADFCTDHHEPWKGPSCRAGTMPKCRPDCPCLVGNSCNNFVWGQMPYAES